MQEQRESGERKYRLLTDTRRHLQPSFLAVRIFSPSGFHLPFDIRSRADKMTNQLYTLEISIYNWTAFVVVIVCVASSKICACPVTVFNRKEILSLSYNFISHIPKRRILYQQLVAYNYFHLYNDIWRVKEWLFDDYRFSISRVYTYIINL